MLAASYPTTARGSLSSVGLLACLGISLGLSLGCTGGASSPVADSGDPQLPAYLDLPMPLNPTLGAPLLGGTLSVDALALTATLTPDREVALDFPLDITPYLTISPGFDCFRALSVTRGPNNTIDVELGLRHPFNPAQRPDLDPFDPRLILGTGGTTNFARMPLGKDGATPQVTILGVPNADGYTGRFKELVGTTTAGTKNPYIDFFTDSNPDPAITGTPIAYHRMAAGAVEDRQILRLDPAILGNTIDLQWIIEAHYGQSAKLANRFSPVYRNPQFNRKEAYAVRTSVTGNTLQEGEIGTTARVRVEVEDWQQGATVAADPDNPGVNEVDAASELTHIILDLPTLTPAAIQLDTPESGSGTQGDPFVFHFDLVNDGSLVAGDYPGLILVEDQLEPFTADFEYRVFQVVVVSVLEVNPPPVKGNWDWSSAANQVNLQPGLSQLWPKEAIAIDSSGRAHIVWTDDSTGGDIAYYARQTGVGSTTFTPAEPIAPAPSIYPTIAIDSADIVHLAWEDGRGLINGSNIRYASRLADGSAAEGEIAVTNVAENTFAIFPKVLARPTGGADIVWSENRTDPDPFPFASANFGIYYAGVDLPATNSPVVGASATVADDVLSEGYPSLTSIDATLYVAYQENALDGTGNRRLFVASGSGSTFDPPIAVTPINFDAGQPDIAVSSTDVLWLAMARGGNPGTILITSSDDLAQTWASLVIFSEGGTPSYTQYAPDIALDPVDNVHVAWHEYSSTTLEPGRIQVRTQYYDGEVGTTQFVTPSGSLAAWPSLAVAPNRDLVVAYQRYEGTNYEIFHQVGVFSE